MSELGAARELDAVLIPGKQVILRELEQGFRSPWFQGSQTSFGPMRRQVWRPMRWHELIEETGFLAHILRRKKNDTPGTHPWRTFDMEVIIIDLTHLDST